MPVISLGRSLTQCEPAAGEQVRLTHCQRGRKPRGLLPAVGWESCLLKICGVCYIHTHRLCLCVCASIACVERPRVTAHDHVCTHVCKSAYCVCTSERECIWYVTCVYSAACVYYIVQHMCTCISVKFHICVCEHGHTCVCLWWTSKWYI